MVTPQWLRFVVVGALNTLFGYGLFALLVWAGLAYPVAIGVATVVGVLFNFQTTGRMVFDGAPRSRLLRFVAVYALVYLINLAAVAVLLYWKLNIYLANALVILPLAWLAYIFQRKFVFTVP
ncbi:MAG: GtrA family protein [Burkholderiales bacterium]